MRSGKLRALGVTSNQRSTVMPEVPTIAEAGLPGYESSTWYGMLAPAGTSKAIVDRLYQNMSEVLRLPDIREKLLAQGLEPVGNRPPNSLRSSRRSSSNGARSLRRPASKRNEMTADTPRDIAASTIPGNVRPAVEVGTGGKRAKRFW